MANTAYTTILILIGVSGIVGLLKYPKNGKYLSNQSQNIDSRSDFNSNGVAVKQLIAENTYVQDIAHRRMAIPLR